MRKLTLSMAFLGVLMMGQGYNHPFNPQVVGGSPMNSVIFGGTSTQTSTTPGTIYLPLIGVMDSAVTMDDTEGNWLSVLPVAGTLGNLSVKLDADIGTGETITFTLRKCDPTCADEVAITCPITLTCGMTPPQASSTLPTSSRMVPPSSRP